MKEFPWQQQSIVKPEWQLSNCISTVGTPICRQEQQQKNLLSVDTEFIGILCGILQTIKVTSYLKLVTNRKGYL